MDNADVFALTCFATLLPFVGMIVWAAWKDITDPFWTTDQQEVLDASGAESGSIDADGRGRRG